MFSINIYFSIPIIDEIKLRTVLIRSFKKMLCFGKYISFILKIWILMLGGYAVLFRKFYLNKISGIPNTYTTNEEKELSWFLPHKHTQIPYPYIKKNWLSLVQFYFIIFKPS